MVPFYYDGTAWIGLMFPAATTVYYGLTRLSSSCKSTSTQVAANLLAVKTAYDRHAWDDITLTNPLLINYGGTGATSREEARTNLGISATALYSGTLTTGKTTFDLGYKVYLVIGYVASGGSRISMCIPGAEITTSALPYVLSDSSNYYTFTLLYADTTVTLSYKARNAAGYIAKVYGIN